MGYLVDAWRREGTHGLHAVVLDTRGSGHIALSFVHLAWTLLVITIFAIRRRLRLVHINLSSHGSTLRKVIVMAVVSAIGAKAVLHLHGSRFESFFRALPRFAQGVVRRMFMSADRVVVLGRHWRNFVIDEIGVPARRVEIVFNGVPDPFVEPIPSAGTARANGRSTHIVFLGRLSERKGVPELLAALDRLQHQNKEWHATLAGDGPVDNYRQEAMRRGLADRVKLPGWVDRDAADKLLRAADIIVLPSHQENQPMSVIEGMAYRVSVIATPVGALPDILSDGNNALLVAPGDVEGLTNALGSLIDSPDLRSRIATAGRATFCKHLQIHIAARQFAEIYDAVSPPRTHR
jgi:glycosyltransferase involved in cell wall biosynthesis